MYLFSRANKDGWLGFDRLQDILANSCIRWDDKMIIL